MRTDYNFTQRFGSLGMTRIPSHYVRGLGFSDAEEYTGTAGQVISALPIPGAQEIGAAVSAIGGLVDKLFGWGDSTPITTLYNKVVELRLQLAEENRAAGIPDAFQIPPGMDATNEGQLETLALVVVNDYLHKVPSITSSMDTSYEVQHDTLGVKLWPAYVHEARDDLYKTIAWLANQLGIANISDTNMALETPPPQTVMQVSPPSNYISPPATETDPNTIYTPPSQPISPAAPSTPTISPMLLIGGGFGVVLLAMMLSRG
jgi:hypothetical protein